MKEYGIYLPNYFEYQNFNNDYNLPILFSRDNSIYIPIESLRKIYKSDEKLFTEITLELFLRGGKPILEKKSHLFTTIDISLDEVIICDSNTSENAFKKIDFELLKIKHYIRFLEINNNDFFDYMPIEGFRSINDDDVFLRLLKKEFLHAGFDIIKLDIEKNEQYIYKENTNIRKNNNIIKEPTDILLNKQKVSIESIKNINSLFCDIKTTIDSNPFYEYVKLADLEMKEIDLFDVDENIKNIYISKLLEYKDELDKEANLKDILTLMTNFKLNLRAISTILINNIEKSSTINKKTVKDVFIEDKFKAFRNYSIKYLIRKLGDYNEEKIYHILSHEEITNELIDEILKVFFTLIKKERMFQEIGYKTSEKYDKYKLRSDKKEMNFKLSSEVDEFINDQLNKFEFLIINKIFKEFENEFKELGWNIYDITSYIRKNTNLEIVGNEREAYVYKGKFRTLYRFILDIVKEHKHGIDLNDLSNLICLNRFYIRSLINSKDDIGINENILYLKNKLLLLDRETIKFVEENCDFRLKTNGYFLLNEIYKDVIFDAEIFTKFKEAGLEDKEEIINTIRSIFPTLKSNMKYISKNDLSYLDIYFSELGEKNKYSRKEILSLSERIDVSVSSISNYLNDFREKGEIVQLSSDYYTKPENINPTEGQKLELSRLIKKEMESEMYLSFSRIIYQIMDLPPFENFDWTVELAKYISIKYLGYKSVEANSITYNLDPNIIKNSNSDLDYYTIVRNEMKDFNKNSTEENVFKFLIERGLIGRNSKNISKSLFSNNVFKRNHLERIEVIE